MNGSNALPDVLERQNKKLSILYEIALTVGKSLDLKTILDEVLEKVLAFMGADGGVIKQGSAKGATILGHSGVGIGCLGLCHRCSLWVVWAVFAVLRREGQRKVSLRFHPDCGQVSARPWPQPSHGQTATDFP